MKRKQKNIDAPGELPYAVMLDVPYITIAGNKEVTVENYRGIISYENTGVKINTNDKIIKIDGENLTLSHITDEIISVSGYISSLEFI